MNLVQLTWLMIISSDTVFAAALLLTIWNHVSISIELTASLLFFWVASCCEFKSFNLLCSALNDAFGASVAQKPRCASSAPHWTEKSTVRMIAKSVWRLNSSIIMIPGTETFPLHPSKRMVGMDLRLGESLPTATWNLKMPQEHP